MRGNLAGGFVALTLLLTSSVAAAQAAAPAAAPTPPPVAPVAAPTPVRVAQDDNKVEVRPHQLLTRYTCKQVEKIVPDFKAMAARSTEDEREINVVWQECISDIHNQANPATPPTVVIVAGDPASSDGFLTETISTNDLSNIQTICEKVAQGAFAYAGAVVPPPVSGAVLVADVATDGGKVDCDAYVAAAKRNDPLIVLAPAFISSTAVTVHVLSMVGLKAPATDIQKEAERVDQVAGAAIAKGTDEIARNPVLLVDPGIYVAQKLAPGPLQKPLGVAATIISAPVVIPAKIVVSAVKCVFSLGHHC